MAEIKFSPREREVIDALMAGYPRKHAAAMLGITESALSRHLQGARARGGGFRTTEALLAHCVGIRAALEPFPKDKPAK
jgi:FixJ family two-component response regulator